MQTLNEVKRQKGSPKPHLRLSFCSTKTSVVNLEDAVRFAKKHEFSQGVQVTPVFAVGNDQTEETYESDPEFFDQYYNRARKLAEELNIPFWIISNPQSGEKDVYCYDPWESINVEPNGDVYPCSVSSQVMGNINKQSIEEIWNGERYQDFRARVNIGGPKQNEDCRNCINCHLHNMKTAANSAVERKVMGGGYYRFKE